MIKPKTEISPAARKNVPEQLAQDLRFDYRSESVKHVSASQSFLNRRPRDHHSRKGKMEVYVYLPVALNSPPQLLHQLP